MDLQDLENTYKIIDNFMDDAEFEDLKSHMLYSQQFPWFYNYGIAYLTDEEKLYDFQFVHTFYSADKGKSTELARLAPLLKKINPHTIYRIKANLGTITPTNMQTGWHTDFDDRVCITAVFYLNTNDGYTIFKNGETVPSVANRLLMFDSRLEHAGVSCTDTNFRSVINLNYTL
jgi:hypothetical protein